MFKSIMFFTLAAFIEIVGCFAFWGFLRSDKSIFWLPVGVVCLVLFAYLLTLIDMEQAGRAYAAYGGIYITASLFWLVIVEKSLLDRWDVIGAGLSLLGAMVILAGHLAK